MVQFNSDDQGPNDYERKSRLARFEGSAAISSSDYYGRDEGGGGSTGATRSGSADFDVSAGELINKLSFQVGLDISSRRVSTLTVNLGFCSCLLPPVTPKQRQELGAMASHVKGLMVVDAA